VKSGDSSFDPDAPEVLSSDARRSPKLIGLFLRQVPIELANVDAALGRGDRTAWKDVAHKLKGSCRAVGASRMADRCEKLERAPEVAEARTARARVADEFLLVKELLEVELGRSAD
jgi:HPt (histidine-containing phosphotransfer) domain-containing protein